MKPLAFIILVFLSLTHRSFAQEKQERNGFSLGIGFVLNDAETVSVLNKNRYPAHSKVFNFSRMSPGISMTLQSEISPRFDWSLTLSGSFTDSALKQQVRYAEKRLFLELDGSIKAKLLDASIRFQPYAQAGVGASWYNQYAGIFIPVGMGLQTKIFRDAFVNVNCQFRYPVTTTARHFYYSIGISGRIGRGGRKKAPARSVSKIPKFTNKAFIVEMDSDRDGIINSLDSCPDSPGIRNFNGCPDSDQDGIPDHLDACPSHFGIIELKGCPAPDRDGDGIADDIDHCPDLTGFSTLKGCPFIDSTILKSVDHAARHILFETGSYEITPGSFIYLDQVSNILSKDPALHLNIEGHTDNEGSVPDNQKLSEDRARAVFNYLMKRGVNRNRMKYIGYGQSKPVGSNESDSGRIANRRVEMFVSY